MKRLIVSMIFFIFSLSITWFTMHATELTACRALDEADRKYIHVAALFHRMKVEGLNDLDLSYTPPLSSPWDPVQMAAQAWLCSLGL